ncbi:hypothetical protein [Isoptericola sp. NPDC058082]|uniref:hypothetical protein n=1 Tax=Isoptericola sp. NPDC058082 TaxID=3346331 RepID=UPI0036E4ABA5
MTLPLAPPPVGAPPVGVAVVGIGADGRAAMAPDAGQVAAAASLRHVADAVLAGERPDDGIAEARESLAVIDAPYRSAATGDVVAVEAPENERTL